MILKLNGPSRGMNSVAWGWWGSPQRRPSLMFPPFSPQQYVGLRDGLYRQFVKPSQNFVGQGGPSDNLDLDHIGLYCKNASKLGQENHWKPVKLLFLACSSLFFFFFKLISKIFIDTKLICSMLLVLETCMVILLLNCCHNMYLGKTGINGIIAFF